MPLLALPLCLLMAGCQSVATTSEGSLMRVIDASSNAPSVDVYAQSTLVFDNLGAPTFSNYAPVAPGTVSLAVNPTGTQTATLKSTASTVAGQQYSLLLTNSGTGDTGSGYQAAVIADQSVAAPPGSIAVRVIESSPLAGDVDVYLVPDGTLLSASTPVFTALTPGTVTTYSNLAAGSYDIMVTPTGKTTALYTGTATVLTGGQVRTLLIVDAKFTKLKMVSVMIGDDLN